MHMLLVYALLALLVFTSWCSTTVRPNDVAFLSSERGLRHDHLDKNVLLGTVERYISWGSDKGILMPDCNRFSLLFGPNGSWISPFAVPNGYSITYLEKTCDELAYNLTWHRGSLTAGKHMYPFYTQDRRLSGIAFAWTAVGASKSYWEFFKRKEYDFSILSALTLFNDTTIFNANDIFWPYSNSSTSPELFKLTDEYVTFLYGDCKKFPRIFWKKFGPLRVSGGEDYFEEASLSAYCYKMQADWTTYVYNIDSVGYSVSEYSGTVDHLAFTWTRTGTYKGSTRHENILTVLRIVQDDIPTKQLTIDSAEDFFDPY